MTIDIPSCTALYKLARAHAFVSFTSTTPSRELRASKSDSQRVMADDPIQRPVDAGPIPVPPAAAEGEVAPRQAPPANSATKPTPACLEPTVGQRFTTLGGIN